MQIKRTATANWNGDGKTGKGKLSTQSGVLDETQYSYNSRFENGIGTNPEELIGAAHAGCFSMKLAFVLQADNIIPDNIDTTATVILEEGTITEILLKTTVSAQNLSENDLIKAANEAKLNCPVSKLFNAKISLEVILK